MSDKAATTPREGETAGVIAPPPLLFFGAIGASFALHALIPLDLGLPRTPGILLGVAIVGGGVGLAIWATRRFKAAGTEVKPWKPSSAVVSDGPFRWTRNPMYLGMLIALAGLAPLAATLWPLLLLPLLWALLRFGVIAREERYLERRFGEAYTGYQARVRRWL